MVKFKAAPLSGTFMITAIVGFLISVFYIFPRSRPWGLALTVLFVAMFVAGMISATYAPIEAETEIEKKKK